MRLSQTPFPSLITQAFLSHSSVWTREPRVKGQRTIASGPLLSLSLYRYCLRQQLEDTLGSGGSTHAAGG